MDALIQQMRDVLAENERARRSAVSSYVQRNRKDSRLQVGRPKTLAPEQITTIQTMIKNGYSNVSKIAALFGVSRATIYRVTAGEY